MTQLSNINEKAKQEALKYIQDNNYDIDDGFIDFAHSLTTKYGEAAAELSCRMYDELHQYWKEAKKSTKSLLPAEPAEVPTRSDVEKAVYGTLKTSVNEIPGAVSRLVKQTAEDTKIKNGMRDGAEFAWIPAGDSCAFCLVLASRGWQRISKKTLKNGHAEHIHANCDCTYTVRFDSTTEVEGYDPELYRRMWDDADGKNAKEKMRNLRKEVRTDEFIGKYGLDDTLSPLDVVDVGKAVADFSKVKNVVDADKEADALAYAERMQSDDIEKFNKIFSEAKYNPSENGSYYDPTSGEIFISEADQMPTTLFHESTHWFDFNQNYTITDDWGGWKYVYDDDGNITGREWNSKIVTLQENAGFSDYISHIWGQYVHGEENTLMGKDTINAVKKLGTSDTYGWGRESSLIKQDMDGINKYLKSKGISKLDPDYDHLSDFISAITYDANLGSLMTGGHSYDYWVKSDTNRVTEIVAGYNLLRATGRMDLIAIERDLAPNLMKLIEEEWAKIW